MKDDSFFRVLFLATAVLTAAMVTAVLVPGCGLLETQTGRLLEDIEGWDLSACVESSAGRETCLQLFLDNADRFLGGATAVQDALDSAIPSSK